MNCCLLGGGPAVLREQVTEGELGELAVALTVMADADKRNRGLRHAILPLLRREIIMESWVYTQGKLKGIEEGKLRGLEEGKLQGLEEGKLRGLEEGKLRGLEEGKVEANLGTLRGLFLRRVGRSPDRAEEESLRRRAAAITPEGLVEVIDLSAGAFLAWLADPR